MGADLLYRIRIAASYFHGFGVGFGRIWQTFRRRAPGLTSAAHQLLKVGLPKALMLRVTIVTMMTSTYA